ncbi:MAG: hypothetical protein NSGCLCUN01_02717 [uncultured Clostridium sp.]
MIRKINDGECFLKSYKEIINKIIELKDIENNKYNIQVYNDGLKIYKNNIFIKGCYYGITREEISSIDLLKKYRW